MFRAIRALLTIVVPFLVVGIAAGTVAGRKAWLEDRLHQLIAVELARVVDREVRVGQVEGDLRRGIVLRDVAIAKKGGFGAGEEVAADEVDVAYDLDAVALGGVTPARAVSCVLLKGVRTTVVRDAAGQVNLADLLPHRKPQFAGKVVLEDADVDVRDEKITDPHGRPLEHHLRDLHGEADFGRAGWIGFAASATTADQSLREVRATGFVNATDGFVSADITATDVALKPWYDFFGARPEVQLLGGRADLRGSAYRLPAGGGRASWQYDAEATLHGVQGIVPRLGREPISLTGEVAITPAGLRLSGADVTVGGVRGRVDGTLTNFADPFVEATVAADHVTWAQIENLPLWRKPLVPPDTHLAVQGEGTVKAQIQGAVKHGTVQGTVDFPGAVEATPEGFSRVKAQGVTVKATVLDWAAPDLTATARFHQLDLGALRLRSKTEGQAPPEESAWPSELDLGSLRDVSVDFSWQNGKLLAAGALAAQSVGLGDLTINEVQARYAYGDRVLRLDDVTGSVRGGRLAGTMLYIAGSKGREPLVHANATVSDCQLQADEPLLGHKLPVSGAISGQAVVSVENGQVSVTGHGILRGGVVAGRPVDSAEALFTATRDDLHLAQVRLVDPTGVVWGGGDIHLGQERKLDLTFTASDLDLGKLTAREGKEAPVTGTAYATGTVTGPLDQPQAELEFEAFGVGYHGHNLDLVTGRGTATYDSQARRISFRTPDDHPLVASYETLGLTANVRLTDYDVDKEDGRIEGTARSWGATVGDLLKFAEQARQGKGGPLGVTEEDVSGPLAGSLDFQGTVKQPRVTGSVEVHDGWLLGYPLARAKLPLEFKDDCLIIREGFVHVADARIGVQGRIRDPEGEALAELDFSALNVPAGAALDTATRRGWLSPRWQLQAEGALDVTGGHLAGSLKDRDSLTVQAEVALSKGGAAAGAPEPETPLVVEGEAITGLSASIRYAHQVAVVDRMAFKLAGGEVVASAAYDLKSEELLDTFNDAEAGKQRHTGAEFKAAALPRVLRLVAPFAAIASGEQEGNRDNGPGLQLYSYAKRTSGVVDADLRLHGPAKEPVGEAHFRISNASLDGRELPSVHGDVQLRGHRLENADVVAELARPSGSPKDAPAPAAGPAAYVRLTGDVDWSKGGPIRAKAEGVGVNLDDLRPYLPRRERELKLGGVASFELALGGTLSTPEVQGWAKVDSPTVGEAQFTKLDAPYVSVLKDQVEVRNLRIARGGEQVEADALIPIGAPAHRPLRVAARLDHTDLSFFPPIVAEVLNETAPQRAEEHRLAKWLRQLKAQGEVTSTLEVTGTLDQPLIKGEFSVLNGSVEHHPVGKGGVEQPSSFPAVHNINVDVVAQSDPKTGASNLTVKQGKFQVGDAQVQVSGRARLDHYSLEDLAQNEYDLKIALTAPEQSVGHVARLKGIDGLAAFCTSPKGTPVLEIDHLTARVGSGQVRVTGSVGVTDFAPARLAYNDWHVTVDVDNADVHYKTKGWYGTRSVYQGPFWTHLTVTTPELGQPAKIQGTSRLHHAVVSLPPLDAGKDEQKQGLYGAGPGFPNFALDWHVDVGDAVQYHSTGIDARLLRAKDAFVLTGTPQEPKLGVQVAYQSGFLTLPYTNVRFRVEDLDIKAEVAPEALVHWGEGEKQRQPLHEPPYRLAYNVRVDGTCRAQLDAPGSLFGRPNLDRMPVDVVMEIHQGGYTSDRVSSLNVLTMVATPTSMVSWDELGRPEVRGVAFRTEPPIDEKEVWSLIGYGAWGAGSQALGLQAHMQEQALTLLTGELRLRLLEPTAEALRKALSLDELTVGFTVDQPVELNIGKYLVKGVLLTYRRPFGPGLNEQYDLRLSYRASGRSYITIATDETEQLSVQFQWSQPVDNWRKWFRF